MPKIIIDGKQITTTEEKTILEVAQENGIYIPRFCYHPNLSIAGNCRICLVEIEKNQKLQTACSTFVSDGMIVHTMSERVKKARADVMEFLLINHPLDCPICDQVGECYLQDYYMEYGLKKSRFRLEDKNQKQKRRIIGKHLILDNERCILCTRCVRFCEEITKTNELFINGRGDSCFIDIKPGTLIDNNYSLNLSDICPVGAITSIDFRFKKRVYLLQTTHSICLGCATGCRIKVQHQDNQIYRILPLPNVDTNTWICDKGRLSYKIVYENRLLHSFIDYRDLSIREIIKTTLHRISKSSENKEKIAVILSNKLSLEDNYSLLYLGLSVLNSDVFYIPIKEQKIVDKILYNCDENPNSNGIKLLVDKFKIKQFNNNNYDLIIGFYDDIKTLNIEESKAIAFSYIRDETFKHLIAIKTYFETEGSFVNYQNILRKTTKAIDGPKNTIEIWKFVWELARLYGVYPQFSSYDELNKIIMEIYSAN